MVFAFHKDARQQFEQQRQVTADHIIPFIEQMMTLGRSMQVLEIGCAEGGALKAFLELGIRGVGVELDEARYARAKEFLAEDLKTKRVVLIRENIHDVDFGNDPGGLFHLIILKDVVEHIHDRPRLLARLRDLLLPDGMIFFSFPPWQMPFGGHQQVCKHLLLARTPYIHLLPNPIYRRLLSVSGESEQRIADLLEIKTTGLSLGVFERLIKKSGYTIADRRWYLINPIYQYKFGLQPRAQLGWVSRLPYIRNYVTTCGYYLVKPAIGQRI